MLRVLLTNDDGIQAPGLRALAAALAPHCELQLVAPERPSSAMGQSITLHKPLRVRPVSNLLPAGTVIQSFDCYECSGTPADCVIVGLHHFFPGRLPHLVLSGVNDGCNVAQDLAYSGTVGGALEGAANSIPSLAFSLLGHRHGGFEQAAQAADLALSLLVYGHPFAWHAGLVESWQRTAATEPALPQWPLPGVAAAWRLSAHYPEPADWLPADTQGAACFNVNFPDLPAAEMRGPCWARPGHRKYTNIVTQVLDPRGEPYYWIAGDRVHETAEPGTDTYALAQGAIPVTPIGYDSGIQLRIERFAAWMRERDAGAASQVKQDER